MDYNRVHIVHNEYQMVRNTINFQDYEIICGTVKDENLLLLETLKMYSEEEITVKHVTAANSKLQFNLSTGTLTIECKKYNFKDVDKLVKFILNCIEFGKHKGVFRVDRSQEKVAYHSVIDVVTDEVEEDPLG